MSIKESIQNREKLAPFVSLFILIVLALAYVFVKMETVRAGYEVLRLGRLEKVAGGRQSGLDLVYAKLTRPERLDHIGTQRLALSRAQKNQVVLMAARGGYAVRQ